MFRVLLFSVLFTFVAEPANFTKTGTEKPVETTKSTGSIKPTESARPRNGVRRENSEQGVNESKTETMYANAKARLEALWGKKWFKYGVVPTSIVAMACGLGHYFGVTGLLYSWLIIQSENAKEPNIEGDGGDQKEEGNVKAEELVDNETSDGNEDVVPKGDEGKASADGLDGDGEGQSKPYDDESKPVAVEETSVLNGFAEIQTSEKGAVETQILDDQVAGDDRLNQPEIDGGEETPVPGEEVEDVIETPALEEEVSEGEGLTSEKVALLLNGEEDDTQSLEKDGAGQSGGDDNIEEKKKTNHSL